MPKHDLPNKPNTLSVPGEKRSKPRWQDPQKGPMKGQRQGKHSRTLRVPGKGSGR